MYDHLVEGIITKGEYKSGRGACASEIVAVKSKLDQHVDANFDYYLSGARILESAEGPILST